MDSNRKKEIVDKLANLRDSLDKTLKRLWTSYTTVRSDLIASQIMSVITKLEEVRSVVQTSILRLEAGEIPPKEITTIDEYQKFKKLSPITKEEIEDVDWRKLLGEL